MLWDFIHPTALCVLVHLGTVWGSTCELTSTDEKHARSFWLVVWILFAAPSTHTAEDHSDFPILSFPHTNICYPLLQALVNFLNYTYIAVNSSPKADAISPMTTVSDIFHVLIINIEWFKSLLTLAIFHLLTGCSMLYFLNFLAFESSVYTRLPDPSYCFCLFSFSFLTPDPFLSHLAI